MNFSYRLSAALIGATIIVAQPQFAIAQLSPQQVEAIGKEITVRIDGGGGGSGVIIDRKDNTYFVLTNHHVVRYLKKHNYVIKTSDDSLYPVDVDKVQELPGFDLALVQFQSNKQYRVAELGNSDQLTGGANVYATGFPVPGPGREKRDYRFSPGEFQRYQPVGDNGYTMVYNSEVIPGMSGGPVLDRVGHIVGINGRSCSVLRLGIPINSFLANQRNLRQLQDGSADNTRPEDFLSLGGAKAEKGDYESAIRDYQRALQSCPDSPDAYFLIGNAQYDAGNKQAAIESFNQVIRINPNSANTYVVRGIVRNDLGDFQGAIADFNESRRLNPNMAEAYADLNEAIRLNLNLAQAYYNRGNVRNDQGDKPGAIADYNEAIRLNPNLAQAYYNRGIVRKNLGDKPGAIADYNQAIRLNPNNAEAYALRGITHYEQGDKRMAIDDLQKAANLFQQQGNSELYKKLLDIIRELQQ